MKLSVEHIIAATGGEIIERGPAAFAGVGTDSRTIERGRLFVPIVGERFDGHNFVQAALERGATGFVFSPEKLPVERAADFAKDHRAAAVAVKDTLKALGDMARFVRESIPGLRVAAVTGSTGKSTVKEMVAAILSESMRVAKSEGNLNNLVGLPLTLLALSEPLDAAVLEMGTNSPGEIARLAEIAGPDVGCVTNVGPVHLEGLRSVKGVAREKGDLARAIKPGGIFVANCDDSFVRAMVSETRADLICYGLDDRRIAGCREFVAACEINAGAESTEMTLVIGGSELRVTVGAPGRHNVLNALAAAAVATAMGSTPDEITRGFDKWRPMGMRGEIRKLNKNVTVLVDCYNSNPVSLDAALTLPAKYPGRRVAVIGDMLELGDYAEEAHKKAGENAAEAGVKMLVAVGDWAQTIKKGFIERAASDAEVAVAKDAEQAASLMMEKLRDGDTILVKGSRLLHLETVVEAIENDLGLRPEEGGD